MPESVELQNLYQAMPNLSKDKDEILVILYNYVTDEGKNIFVERVQELCTLSTKLAEAADSKLSDTVPQYQVAQFQLLEPIKQLVTNCFELAKAALSSEDNLAADHLLPSLMLVCLGAYGENHESFKKLAENLSLFIERIAKLDPNFNTNKTAYTITSLLIAVCACQERTTTDGLSEPVPEHMLLQIQQSPTISTSVGRVSVKLAHALDQETQNLPPALLQPPVLPKSRSLANDEFKPTMVSDAFTTTLRSYSERLKRELANLIAITTHQAQYASYGTDFEALYERVAGQRYQPPNVPDLICDTGAYLGVKLQIATVAVELLEDARLLSSRHAPSSPCTPDKTRAAYANGLSIACNMLEAEGPPCLTPAAVKELDRIDTIIPKRPGTKLKACAYLSVAAVLIAGTVAFAAVTWGVGSLVGLKTLPLAATAIGKAIACLTVASVGSMSIPATHEGVGLFTTSRFKPLKTCQPPATPDAINKPINF